MKKKNFFVVALIIIICVTVIIFIYLPKKIDTALNRIGYPFEVGEILATQQIEENLTTVIYTNKEKTNQLQNAIIQKIGFFYKVIDRNGSINIEKPKKLESGDARTEVLISWYDKSDKYVIMAIAYDEDVDTIKYLNKELIKTNINGYNLFYGFGDGEYKPYELFDKNGNILERIKE